MHFSSVKRVQTIIEDLLLKAQTVKSTSSVEPALTGIDFKGTLDVVGHDNQNYAAIETASRAIFQDTIISTTITEPDFVKVWNLLDIISLLGDNEQCDPALSLWLIEELLDTQTIEGCRVVFDYLESRRERLIQRHFEKRKLIILRSCNELLRRLSRAEDTVFCGRVFIFLFQAFPLGDKSSVNLRGEYHTENKTAWDELAPQLVQPSVEMEIDGPSITEKPKDNGSLSVIEGQVKPPSRRGTPVPDLPAKPGVKSSGYEHPSRAKKPEPVNQPEPTLDMNTLYPIFWALQDTFSEPTRLLDVTNFTSFKNGLKVTIDKFQEAQKKQEGRVISRQVEEAVQGTKRKRGEDDEVLNGYTPKYLTSRDLFDLEISDLAFRRHVMVQSLILIDFLLSLTPEAKAKNEDITNPNKPIQYPNVLSPEDQKWAIETRSKLVAQLKSGPEGAFYYRMIDTVLSRDKNWVRWKVEGCPPMQRPPIATEEWQKALGGAKTVAANKRLRQVPLGALDITFLEDSSMSDLNILKDPSRYKIPAVEDFEGPISDDQFSLDTSKDVEEKERLLNEKNSKVWRVLRLAARDRLSLLDKVDEKADNLDPLFRPAKESEKPVESQEKMEETGSQNNEAQPADETMTDAPEIKVHSPAVQA